jgi:hypothetical protein
MSEADDHLLSTGQVHTYKVSVVLKAPHVEAATTELAVR